MTRRCCRLKLLKVININLEENHEILEQCRPLYEYSWFIRRIKEHQERNGTLGEAIRLAMKDCQKEGIMEDFLLEYGSEVENMLFTEFNMEDALEVRGEERYQEGRNEGRKDGLIALIETCQELGLTPSSTIARLCEKFSLPEQEARETVELYWK